MNVPVDAILFDDDDLCEFSYFFNQICNRRE